MAIHKDIPAFVVRPDPSGFTFGVYAPQVICPGDKLEFKLPAERQWDAAEFYALAKFQDGTVTPSELLEFMQAKQMARGAQP